MTCILRAGGVNFDVEAFIAGTWLVIDSSWRKGEQRLSRSKTPDKVNASSGVCIVASLADFAELARQIEDAILFLGRNLASVQRLSSFSGVEGVVLDFGAEIHPSAWASFTFPVELLRLAGEAGVAVSLSIYPAEEEEEESDA